MSKLLKGALLVLCGLIVCCLMFTVLSSVFRDTAPSAPASPQGAPRVAAPTPAPAPKPVGAQWHYSTKTDEMGRGTIKTATVLSTNELHLDFPYGGAQPGEVMLRIHPKYGKDVVLSIERGQFKSDLDGCEVTVRFDEDKPQTYHASEAADGSSNVLFLNNYEGFVARCKKAKRLRIEAPFYQQGNQIFEFDVEGLKW